MVDILAAEYSRTGEPTNWVWYLLDDGQVLVLSEASDPSFPDMMSGDGTIVGSEDAFVKIQGKNYDKKETIYAKDFYTEPDFDKIFGKEDRADEFCIVVYDKEVYNKMMKRFVRRRGK